MRERRARREFLEADARVFGSWALTPRVHQLQLRAPNVELRVVELGEGQPTLFLHGFGLCTAHWASLVARLPSTHSIAIDMPGHGGSQGVDYTGVDLRRWYVEMLASCLNALGLESVHVVGHSMGGMIGMWFALDAPDRVRSLTAIGAPAVALGNRVDFLRVLGRPVIGQLMLSMPKPRPMFRSILVSTIGRQAVEAAPQDLIRASYLLTQMPGYGKNVSTYLREMFRGVDASPQRYVLSDDELARIQPPTLILWGRDEKSVPPMGNVQERAALIPNARFELVPGGHEPWLDDLDSTARQVATHLAGRDSPAALTEAGG